MTPVGLRVCDQQRKCNQLAFSIRETVYFSPQTLNSEIDIFYSNHLFLKVTRMPFILKMAAGECLQCCGSKSVVRESRRADLFLCDTLLNISKVATHTHTHTPVSWKCLVQINLPLLQLHLWVFLTSAQSEMNNCEVNAVICSDKSREVTVSSFIVLALQCTYST